MIDDLLRNNLVIREWTNGGLVPLNISLVIVIGLFLWSNWEKSRKHHPHNLTMAYGEFHKVPGVPTACALIWIFVADALRAISAWYILWTAINKTPPAVSSIENVWVSLGFILAGVIGLLASIQCIYLFTPAWEAPVWAPSWTVNYWRHFYWVISLIATLTFQIVT